MMPSGRRTADVADLDLPALRKAAGLLVPWEDLADLADVEPDTMTRWCRAVTGTPEPHPPPEHGARSATQRLVDQMEAENLPPLPPPRLDPGEEATARAVVGAILQGRREARAALLARQRELVHGPAAPGVAAMLKDIREQLAELSGLPC